MANTKTYTCLCGATFDNWSLYGGHKQCCSTFLIDKYGSLDNYYAIKNRNHNRGKALSERAKIKKEQELQQWINAGHTCEKCGKVMTEKWGSGRFCSHSCANSRPKDEAERARIGKAVSASEKFHENNSKKQHYYEHARLMRIEQYNKNPNTCEVCGAILDYNKRDCKTCCDQCKNELHRQFRNSYIAENGIVEFNKKGYKYGWYKGYHCDSSWELAFVMYHLDNNITIERNNKTYFEYIFENSIHRFFPDFIVDGTFIEIKGMESEQCDCKVRDIPDGIKFKILYCKDMKPYLEYAENTYGKEFYNLYDKNKSSWMNNLKNQNT